MKVQALTTLRTAEDWPRWLDDARAAVRILKLGDYVDLDGKKGTKDIKEPDRLELPEYPQGGPAAGEAR